MNEEKRGCPWWKKLLAALAICLFTLLCLFFGLRRPWIEPLPGVRVEPTRPVMRRSDFGPESPYLRLINLLVDLAESEGGNSLSRELLAIAGRLPPTPTPEEFFASPAPAFPEPVAKKPSWWWPGMDRQFHSENAELVLQKLRHHPWPDAPPPPAPVSEPVYALPSITIDSEDPFSPEGGRLHTKGIFHARDMFVGGETFGERDRFHVHLGMFGGVMFGGWKYSLGTQEEGMPGKPVLDAPAGEPIYRLPYAAFAEDAPWNLEQCQDVRRILQIYEPFFPRLDPILADPAARIPTVDRYDMSLPELPYIRRLSSWLAVAAQAKAASGDWDGAFLCIGRILQLADMLCRGGGILNHLVAWRGVQAAMESAWHIASRYPVPAPILKQAARDILAHADAAEPYVEALRNKWLAEKNWVPDIYRYMEFKWVKDRHLLRYSGGPGMPTKWFARSAFVILTPLMGSTPEASTRNLHACHQHLTALAEQPYSARTKAEYDNLQARLAATSEASLWLGSRDPVGRIWAGLSLPKTDPRAQRAAHDAQLHGMALFLALRAYELEHGGVPETLDALVPDYLPRIPEDPFDGQPFRYLPRAVPGLPPDAWAVYSIGENFVDDGGKGYDMHHAGHALVHFGRRMPDLVFPSQP